MIGLPDDDVSLASGSMWNTTTASQPWLRGSRPVKVGSGWTDYGQFASVRADVATDVWFYGEVLDVSGLEMGERPNVVPGPRPVLGVALSTGDRVWWLRRVASA